MSQREGFSLEVQEDALRQYVTKVGGEIIKLFRIAETASKTDERKAFRELMVFAKKHSPELDGLLFYKVDRAARNLFEYSLGFETATDELNDIVSDWHGVRVAVDKKSVLYLDGMEIDYHDGIEKRGFVFNNPNATKSCGCGTSFTV
ncbi:MAG: iron-sulfur cluster assembly accessory protein [Planctomycetia bacterium]|nr:iron-sulfur cluster assembly accessory protein [Planctomycetia bacterium]